MKLAIILFFEFVKIGFFAIGGGYATLPFLYQLSLVHHWFIPGDLTQMLAIASMMPGPIGINLASQVGFKVNGLIGTLIAVAGIMIPSLFFVFAVSKLLKKFEGNKFVLSIMYMLKPTSCGMVIAIGVSLLKDVVFPHGVSVNGIDWIALVLFIILFTINFKKKLPPLAYLGFSAFVGITLTLLHIAL